MKDAAPQTIYLSDYTPPAYLVDAVHLTFKLAPTSTRVLSRITFRPNPATANRDFFLQGVDLQLISAAINGAPVTPQITDQGLHCTVPDT
ncbi:MAG: aminopeptidase N, partial [Paracoccaceae bacterium]|nr:aminopeptidase N [Paracoccaceae bacterium]